MNEKQVTGLQVAIYYDEGDLSYDEPFLGKLPSNDAELLGIVMLSPEYDGREFKSEMFKVLVDGLYEKGLPASALRFFTSDLEGHKNLLFVAIGADPYSYIGQIVLPQGYRFLFDNEV